MTIYLVVIAAGEVVVVIGIDENVLKSESARAIVVAIITDLFALGIDRFLIFATIIIDARQAQPSSGPTVTC